MKQLLQRAFHIQRDEGFRELVTAGWRLLKFWWKKGTPRLRFRRWILARRGIEFSDACPFKYVYVDPMNVEYTVAHVSAGRLGHSAFAEMDAPMGAVIGGEWDTNRTPIDDLLIYGALIEHFDQGIQWPETTFYSDALAEINNGDEPYGCTSESDLINKCEKMETLVRCMWNDGFKTQRELGTGRAIHEVKISIGRNGELLFNRGGRHRLTAAKYAGLDEIPVLIQVRHRKWQRIRDRIRCGDEITREHHPDPRTLDGHPDLMDISPTN